MKQKELFIINLASYVLKRYKLFINLCVCMCVCVLNQPKYSIGLNVYGWPLLKHYKKYTLYILWTALLWNHIKWYAVGVLYYCRVYSLLQNNCLGRNFSKKGRWVLYLVSVVPIVHVYVFFSIFIFFLG